MKKLLSEKLNIQIYNLIFLPLFFVVYFLYAWLIINPVLYYQRQVPLFYFDKNFFSEYLTYPGGIIEYISTFLSQFYYYPWLGALVITMIALLITFNVKKILKDVSESKQILFFNLVPVVLLLVLHNRYEHPLSINVGLLFVLSAYNLFYKTAPKSILRLLYYCIFIAIVYYAAAALFFLFVIMCLLQEVFIKKRNDLGFFYLLIAGAIPYVAANYIFILSIQKAYTYALHPGEHYVPVYNLYYLYLYFPVVFLLIYLFSKFAPVKFKKSLVNFFIFKGAVKFAITAVILLLGGWLILDNTLDEYNKKFLQIENFACNHEWQKILDKVDPDMLNNKMVAFQLNRALYHSGKLASDMFTYPQLAGVEGLVLSNQISSVYPLDKCDIMFELGHVSEAQHWAFESFAQTGYSPLNLQRLVLINLVKGNDQVVIKCLDMLNKTLLFRGWSAHYRKYLYDKSLIQKDTELNRIKSAITPSDFIVNLDSPQYNFELLLSNNKNNKMAFEYLMACFLLNRKIKSFLRYMDFLPGLGYRKIPRQYEEAILAYLSLTPTENNKLAINRISFNTRQDFADLMNIMKKNHNNKAAAYNEVASKYGSTYWTYLLYYQ